MATVRPFAALRPKPEFAASICELPYDVMSSEEAREIARGNPLSFLRVSKPEIDLPPGTDPHSDAVYAKGRENLDALRRSGALVQDAEPCLHVYRQSMGGHVQTGIAAVFSCREYLEGTVRRHELTRPDKEDDRVRHLEVLDAQTGPAFLTYRAVPELDALVAGVTAGTPAVDFTAADGIRHTAWVMGSRDDMAKVDSLFRGVPRLYIADGHHRSAAAGRVFQSRQGRGGSDHFLAVVFPHNQLRIMPYNRVVRDLNSRSVSELVANLKAVCEVVEGAGPAPARRHEVSLYVGGRWLGLRFKDALVRRGAAIDQLDVSLLQQQVLGPLLGIEDPRRSDRISFVGGIRGTAELEKLVNGGGYACAFSMFPTAIEELMEVADADAIMPPKSTWFEPKLRDGMFCHVLGA